jgi:hypothetical protein
MVESPIQVPVVQLNVCPSVAVPDTTGATVFVGGVNIKEIPGPKVSPGPIVVAIL